MDIYPQEGRIFITDHDNGSVYFYKASVPLSADYPLELVSVVNGPKKSRVIKYWKDRNELYIGSANGRLSVIEISKFDDGVICKNSYFSI